MKLANRSLETWNHYFLLEQIFPPMTYKNTRAILSTSNASNILTKYIYIYTFSNRIRLKKDKKQESKKMVIFQWKEKKKNTRKTLELLLGFSIQSLSLALPPSPDSDSGVSARNPARSGSLINRGTGRL